MTEHESGGVKVPLPSKDELARLPRRALMAFAGRCARRLQPLFTHSWPGAPKEHVEAVDRAIALVQTSAVSPVSTSDLAAAAKAAYAAAADAKGGLAALAAYAAADAAAFADAFGDAFGDAAVDAADAAANAVYDHADATAVMRRDYELLSAAAKREAWNDDTSVPPEFFGPLWPDGEPEGWPEDEKGTPKSFGMVIDPGEADAETIREVMSALSDLHEVHTGYGLTYEVDGSLILAEVEALT